jgi:hypothetical protein
MRWLRSRWAWLGAALVVAVAIGLAVLPEVVRRVAVSQIRAATGREVAIGDVDLNVFTGTLAVKTFRLADRGRPEPFVQFERLRVRLRLLPLLSGHVRLAELALQAPVVRVVRTGPRTFNFSDLLEPAAPERRERRFHLTVDRLTLAGGAFSAHDEAITPSRTWKLDQLSVEARDLSTRAADPGGAVQVAVKLGETPISLRAESVRLAPAGARAELHIRGFDLSLLLPYLPPDAPAALKSGRFSAALTLDHGGAATRVDGEARFDQLVLLRRGQVAPFASLPALTVALTEINFSRDGLAAKRIDLAGDASVLDESVSPPARLDLRGVRATAEQVTWPARGPTPVRIEAGLPGGGRFDTRGTVGLAPVSADLRVILGNVDLAPFRAYVPVAARIGGRADADVVVVARAGDSGRELTATVRGRAGVSRLTVAPGERPALEIERAEATGLDIAWPTRVAVARVLVRKPTAVIERDERGALPLRSLLAPRAGAAPSPQPATPAPARAKMAIDIGEILIEDGYARFVDRTLTPPYSEEISRLAVSLRGLSNASGKRARLLVQGIVGAGSALDLRGEVAPLGETLFVDLDGELRDFAIPRANSFLDRVLAWIARDGRLTTRVHYRIEGDRLEATNEIVIGRLELSPAGEGDEVKRRLGLPLGLLVALMKDARGEIRISVPVSGRLGAPEFSFAEAIWTAVRNAVVNILAAPFRLIGKLFTSGDRIEAVGIDPLRFEPGSAAVGPATAQHLQRVGEFLQTSPYVRLALTPVVTDADLASLKLGAVTARIQRLQRERRIAEFSAAAARAFQERFPGRPAPKSVDEIVTLLRDAEPEPEGAARALAARRLEATREALAGVAGIPAERLPAGATPVPPGAAGDGRVEFSVTQ